MKALVKSVNFGIFNSGLSNIGYTLKNYDGSIKQARNIFSIIEIVSGEGIYGGIIIIDVNWSGFLIWDTGTSSPEYAIENINYEK